MCEQYSIQNKRLRCLTGLRIKIIIIIKPLPLQKRMGLNFPRLCRNP